MKSTLFLVLLVAGCGAGQPDATSPEDELRYLHGRDMIGGPVLVTGVAPSSLYASRSPSLPAAAPVNPCQNQLGGVAFCNGAQVRVCTGSGASSNLIYDCATDMGNTSPTNPLVCSIGRAWGYVTNVITSSSPVGGTVVGGCQYRDPIIAAGTITGIFSEWSNFERHSYFNEEPYTGAAPAHPFMNPYPPRNRTGSHGGSLAHLDDGNGVSIGIASWDVATPYSFGWGIADTSVLTTGVPTNVATLAGATGELRTGTPNPPYFNQLYNMQTLCTSWSGTVTQNAAPPAWSYTLDLTCATNAAYKFGATITGQL
jgi:hypothetical protein